MVLNPRMEKSENPDFIDQIRNFSDSQHLKVAFFDLEGTLVEGSIWRTLNKAFGVPRSESRKLFDNFFDGKISYREWVDSLEELWCSSDFLEATRGNIRKICDDFEVIPEAEKLLEEVRDREYFPVSISGAPKIYSDKIASQLGIEVNVPTHRFVFDGGNEELEDIEILNGYDFSKAHLLGWIKEKICPERVIAFGDDVNDLDMCKKADLGFLVDKGLEEIRKEDLEDKNVYLLSLREMSENLDDYL